MWGNYLPRFEGRLPGTHRRAVAFARQTVSYNEGHTASTETANLNCGECRTFRPEIYPHLPEMLHVCHSEMVSLD
jgi:hypothetical protein